MPDTASQITVTTRRYIDTNPQLRDLVFNHDPMMSMIGEECHDEVEGGSSWNDNIEYDVQDGGPYSKGQDLPADQRQIEQQLRFDPKYNTIMIPFYKEDIKVLNVSALAVVKLVEERVDAAFIQLGAQAALQMYLQGQTGNYVKFPNGLRLGRLDLSDLWHPDAVALRRQAPRPQAVQFCWGRDHAPDHGIALPVGELRLGQVRVQRDRHDSHGIRVHPQQLPDAAEVPECLGRQSRVPRTGIQRRRDHGLALRSGIVPNESGKRRRGCGAPQRHQRD